MLIAGSLLPLAPGPRLRSSVLLSLAPTAARPPLRSLGLSEKPLWQQDSHEALLAWGEVCTLLGALHISDY